MLRRCSTSWKDDRIRPRRSKFFDTVDDLDLRQNCVKHLFARYVPCPRREEPSTSQALGSGRCPTTDTAMLLYLSQFKRFEKKACNADRSDGEMHRTRGAASEVAKSTDCSNDLNGMREGA